MAGRGRASRRLLFGACVSTLVGSGWLSLLIFAGLINSRSQLGIIGWVPLMLAGALLAGVVPILLYQLVLLAEGWFRLLVAVGLTGAGGVVGLVVAFSVGTYSSPAGMAGLVTVWTLVAVASALISVFRMGLGHARLKLLAAGLLLSVLLVIPAWWSLLLDTLDTTGWFAQASLAASLGLGCGVGAIVGSLLSKEKQPHDDLERTIESSPRRSPGGV